MDNIIDIAASAKQKQQQAEQRAAQATLPQGARADALADVEELNTWVFELKSGEQIIDDGHFAVTPNFVALLSEPGVFSVVIPMDNLLSATNLGPREDTEEV